MRTDLKSLMGEVRAFSEKRNWTQYQNPKDLAIALLLESSEVLEHFRFKTTYNADELAKELADVLNIVLRLSDVIGIDLAYWFYQKMHENEKKYPVEKFYGKNLKYSKIESNNAANK
jgi:NTP pyrophosphatase (non-canonical NTP hydrolase)